MKCQWMKRDVREAHVMRLYRVFTEFSIDGRSDRDTRMQHTNIFSMRSIVSKFIISTSRTKKKERNEKKMAVSWQIRSVPLSGTSIGQSCPSILRLAYQNPVKPSKIEKKKTEIGCHRQHRSDWGKKNRDIRWHQLRTRCCTFISQRIIPIVKKICKIEIKSLNALYVLVKIIFDR